MNVPPPDPPEFRRYPTILAAWLETATVALVPSAQARIHTEIEAHYTDAVNAHLHNGTSKSLAHAGALASLGDARAAGRRFRQNHLTTHEANLIRDNVAWYRKRYTVIEGLCIFCFALVMWAAQPKCNFPPLWLMVSLFSADALVAVTVGTRNLALATLNPTASVARQLLLNHILRISSFMVVVLACFSGVSWNILHAKSNDLSNLFLLAMTIWLVFYLLLLCYLYSQTCRKLLFAGEDWTTPPPSQPTLA